MLNLNLSNRFEDLLAALLKNLHSSPASVFEPERIIMPSAAVKRCLTMAIADTFGVCANVEFSFLAQWLWRQVGHLVPVQKTSPFSSTVLVWRILRLLEEPGFADPYPRLSAYLSSSDELMRYDLAARLASLMEQYVIYRPDWLSAWAKGERVDIVPADHKKFDTIESDQRWQAALWRQIAAETGTLEKQPVELFFEAISDNEEKAASLLDARIHLFCEPSIAPQYIEMLEKLGRLIDIELYVLNPCREYWFDIIDSRKLAYLANRQKDLYHETGNALLASWGKQTKASLESMHDRLDNIEREDEAFISNAELGVPETLLSHLQDAIFDLRELEPASLSHLGDDGSIRIHVAHSLTREIEILHDQLLLRFASDDPPTADRILVVTPDLDAAAPMIEAVFSSHNSHQARIPYTITGLSGNRINPVARALLDLLALASSRFSASDVIDLLMQPVIGKTFGFDGDLKTLRNWFADAGICWGLDGAHKAEFDLPEEDSHSFHDGMHRLFLAYALPDGEQMPLANRLPAGNPSGSQAVALGQLWQFIGGLRRLKRELSKPKTADGWLQTFSDVLDSFMTVSTELIESEREVRSCIGEWHAAMAEGSPELLAGFAIARHALERALEGAGQGSVPVGTVTFAPMDSLRNLPFDHIYAIGLDDGVFPADRYPDEFDLIGVAPRKSDKLPRESDRNVFLDLVLSARKSLTLSYSGKNIRDNSAKPPSILISELLKSLKPALAVSNDPADLAAAERMLVVVHPLQAFSADYFNGRGDPRLVSFRTDLCEALKIRQESQAKQQNDASFTVSSAMTTDESDDDTTTDKSLPFFSGFLPKPEPVWQEVSLEQLVRFFSHPARYLLRQRLGIRFSSKEEELPSAEPFTIDRQNRRQLANRLLPLFLDGHDEESIRLAALAGNEFPPGKMGKNRMEQELMELAAFARTAQADLQPGVLAPVTGSLDFIIDGEVWRLSGSLTELRQNGLVRLRYDNGSAWDYLAGWIEHLFLNAVAPEEIAPHSVWHYKNESVRLAAYEEAKNRLVELVDIYRTGLVAPVHFFPRSSWEFVSSDDNMNRARGEWIHAQHANGGEHAERYTQLAMRGVDNPLDDDFIELSKRVFAPLYGHLNGFRHEFS